MPGRVFREHADSLHDGELADGVSRLKEELDGDLVLIASDGLLPESDWATQPRGGGYRLLDGPGLEPITRYLDGRLGT